MKVYIAGPIAGKVNGNREAFAERAAQLKEMGHEPLNPHDILPVHGMSPCIGEPLEGDSEHQYGCYLRADIEQMMFCGGITLLPGWWRSKGASAEEYVARSIGLTIVEVP